MKIEVLRLAIDFGLMVLIWMVQILIYPGFQYLDDKSFIKWHRQYAGSMGFIVAPMMFAQVGLAFYFFYYFPEMFSYNVAYAALIGLTWISTFTIFVPLHKKLDQLGKVSKLCQELTRKNWIRVIFWTAIVLLDLQLLYRFI